MTILSHYWYIVVFMIKAGIKGDRIIIGGIEYVYLAFITAWFRIVEEAG